MTSIAAESVSSILVSSKQTRFHIQNPNYRELDVEGLNITVTSGDKTSAKGKGRAKGEGLEILTNATLRLKAGQRYALIGRNGSGKSTLLRAIAEKLIPGIPEQMRVSILQQTNAEDADADGAAQEASPEKSGSSQGNTVLDEVIDRAISKNELEQEINALSHGVNSTAPHGALRALRTLRHQRLQKRLFVLDKEARLRSGARGLQARKALTAFEKTVADSAALNEQADDEITADALQAETQEAADMLAELQIQVEPSRLAEVEARAKKILTGLGFSDAYMNKAVSSLSGGWKMRTALAGALLSETDILILDEPTNFLDLLGIVWLQRYLQSLEDRPEPPTLILVSHDRDFIGLCTDLLILKDKSLTYYHGDLPSWEASTSEKKLHMAKMKEAKDRQKAHIQEAIARNMREGKKSNDDKRIKQAKMQQRKLDDRWGLEVNAKGHRFKLNRDREGWHNSSREDVVVPPEERPVTIVLPPPPDLRFPGPLVSIEKAAFRYPPPDGGKKAKASSAKPPPVLEDIDLSVSMGDRVGILGLNGAGKSTLIKLLVEAERPTSGSAAHHPRLRLAHYGQHAVEALQVLGRAEPVLTALALLSREAGDALDEGEARGLLGSLGLPGRLASDVPVCRLSGGQLVRCELARLLWRAPHCLVLDEVTTHLDYETITALRVALAHWEGAVVVASHDRWFVRGAVEGLVDDDDSDAASGRSDDSDEVDEHGFLRRRVVYRLRAGRMTKLENGVQEFEDLMDRRVQKLLRD